LVDYRQSLLPKTLKTQSLTLTIITDYRKMLQMLECFTMLVCCVMMRFVVFTGNKAVDFSIRAHSEAWWQWRHCVLILPPAALETNWWGTEPTQLHMGRKSVILLVMSSV